MFDAHISTVYFFMYLFCIKLSMDNQINLSFFHLVNVLLELLLTTF